MKLENFIKTKKVKPNENIKNPPKIELTDKERERLNNILKEIMERKKGK